MASEKITRNGFEKAARQGDAKRVCMFWSEFNGRGVLIDSTSMLRAILHCHPAAAGEMMAGLRTAAHSSLAGVLRGQLYVSCHTVREKVKLLSVLHAAGFSLGRPSTYTFAKPLVRQHVDTLTGYRHSNHASIEERRIEPDPDALIARPMGNIFHGTVPGTSRRDILLWQPLIGWWKRQSSEVRTLITLLMFLGLFMAIVLLAMDG